MQSWEFCRTLPRWRLFDLREEIREWGDRGPTEMGQASALIDTINVARGHLDASDISAAIVSVRTVAETAPTSYWRQRAAAIADHLERMARR